MILLAVTYHYFAAARRPDARAVFPVTPDELSEQLTQLGRAFEFISRDDLVAAVAGERSLPEQACAITFDDGLRSQYELALPVLDALEIPGIFFVTAGPLVERRLLHVHRVHWLRERLDDEQLLDLALDEMARAGVDLDGSDLDPAAQMYRYDHPAAARVKFLLQHALPEPLRERVANAAFRAAGGDEDAVFDDLYMDASAVADLAGRRALGAHALTHRPLAGLSASDVRHELDTSRDILERVSGERPLVLSYPFGAAGTVVPETAHAASASGFVAGFTTERCLNRTLEQPLLLGRIDANDAPGGRRPLLQLDDSTVRLDGLEPGRRRYFEELVDDQAGVS
jgi:peptidoglycan/xylan/chitin deacetylase (PgdA/CDA1 family)